MGDVLVTEGDGTPHPVAVTPKVFGDEPIVQSRGGMQLPSLGIGTYRLCDDVARTVVRAALERGVRHIDTAQMYRNEAEIGAAVRESGVDRDRIHITTKIDNDNHSPGALVESVRRSLSDLGTDYVDLLLVHWPVAWDGIGATLSTLAQVHASGSARHIGVSNFTVEQLEVAQNYAPLETLQVECHPYFQQRRLRRWCEERGWAFTAYSPLAQGSVVDEPALAAIAGELGVTAPAVALAWLMSLPQVATIPRTGTIDHLEANLAARHVQLSAEQIDRIEQLDRNRRIVDPDFAPWNEGQPT